MTLTNIRPMALFVAGTLTMAGQSGSKAMITNLDTAHWTHDKGEPAGSEGVMLRTDAATGGMDLLVRFPAGHVISPHSHESNERIIVVEGQLTLRQDAGDAHIDAGGYAFLPAREVQRLACSSTTRCTFYLSWDGKPDSRPAK
jgi:quercetin dioxygenase-like cupin family protein